MGMRRDNIPEDILEAGVHSVDFMRLPFVVILCCRVWRQSFDAAKTRQYTSTVVMTGKVAAKGDLTFSYYIVLWRQKSAFVKLHYAMTGCQEGASLFVSSNNLEVSHNPPSSSKGKTAV